MPSDRIAARIVGMDRAVRQAALLERQTVLSEWRQRRVAVVPLDAGAPTSAVAALIAATSVRCVDGGSIAVDCGQDRPLAHLLGARHGGDLQGLGSLGSIMVSRATIRSFVDADTATCVPTICPPRTDPVIAAETLDTALLHVKRQYRGCVVDVPSTVAAHLMPTALRHCDVVVAVTAGPDVPGWLFNDDTPLSPWIERGAVLVVRAYGDVRALHTVTGRGRSVHAIDLGITVYGDGRWDFPATAHGLDLGLAGVTLSSTVVELGQFVFAAA